jgi:uncharacterized protein
VQGEISGALKLKIATPPVGGKANQECIRFLAELLGVPRNCVEIISGETSRTKVVRVKDVTSQDVLKKLGP